MTVWLVLLLLGSTTINSIDRQSLSVLAPVLREEFNLSNSDYAGILNAFMVFYTIMWLSSLPVRGDSRVALPECV